MSKWHAQLWHYFMCTKIRGQYGESSGDSWLTHLTGFDCPHVSLLKKKVFYSTTEAAFTITATFFFFFFTFCAPAETPIIQYSLPRLFIPAYNRYCIIETTLIDWNRMILRVLWQKQACSWQKQRHYFNFKWDDISSDAVGAFWLKLFQLQRLYLWLWANSVYCIVFWNAKVLTIDR